MTAEKRYQVFISSTFDDLREERRAVIQTVMELDCIPAGMELFPATDDEQWAFIRRIIDDCDYYLLILGARYGSLTKEGVSFTEVEFDYAVDAGIRVLAFLQESPEVVRAENPAEDDSAFKKLLALRERVAADRLVKYWKDGSDLPGLVALSLAKTIKTYPATGWIRASEAASLDILHELNEMRKERDALQERVRVLQSQLTPMFADLAGIEGTMTLHGKHKMAYDSRAYSWEATVTFGQIFGGIAPYLMDHPSDAAVKGRIMDLAFQSTGKKADWTSLDDQAFQTVKMQLIALKLVNVKYSKTIKGGMGTFWSLTDNGRKLMFELRTVRREGDEA